MACYAGATLHPWHSAGWARAVDANGRLLHESKVTKDSVTIRGVITSVNIPSTLTNGFFFSVYDATCDSSVTVYGAAAGFFAKWPYTYKPTIGDSVEVNGGMMGYRVAAGFGGGDSTGFAVLSVDTKAPKDTIYLLGSSKSTPAPIKLRKLTERHESDIVYLDSFALNNPSDWTVTTGFGAPAFVNINVTSLNDTSLHAVLHVAAGIINGTNAYSGKINGTMRFTGVEYQDANFTGKPYGPYTKGYQLMLRDKNDVMFLAGAKSITHKISDVNHEKTGGSIPDSIGKTMRIKGIVQSSNLYVPELVASGFGTALTKTTGLLFSIMDKSGSITIYDSNSNWAYTPTIGDSVFVEGRIAQKTKYGAGGFGGTTFNTGWLVMKPDSISLPSSSTGNAINAPIVTTALADSMESKLIKIQAVKLVNPNQWDTTGTTNAFTKVYTPKNRFFVDLLDASGNKYRAWINRIDSLYTMAKPSGYFDITGIEGQDTLKGSPFWSIWPRFKRDIVPVKAPYVATHNIVDVNRVNASGIASSLGKILRVKGIVQSVNLYAPDSVRGGFGGTISGNNGILFSIFDKTGSIMVYDSSSNWAYTPTIGDSFFVEGRIAQKTRYAPAGGFGGGTTYNTGWVIIKPDSIAIPSNSHGNSIMPSLPITSLLDSNESKLIKIQGVKLVTPSQWDTTGVTVGGFGGGYRKKFRFFVDLVDISGNKTRACITRIDSLFFMKKPTGTFNITGIEAQEVLSTSKYSIWPRFHQDIVPVMNLIPIKHVKGNDGSGVNLTIGTTGLFKGIVHSENLLKGGTQFSLVDDSGAITVYSTSNTWKYSPKRGDSVKVYGTVDQLNGLAVILPDSMIKISAGYSLTKASVVPHGFIENDESYLRQLKNVVLYSPSQWVASGNGFGLTVKASSASDTFTVFISAATSAFMMSTPGASFDITGVVQQNAPSTALKTGYYLVPRDSNDITVYTGIQSVTENAMDVKLYPNPVNSLLHIQIGDTKGEAVNMSIYSSLGQVVLTQKIYSSTDVNTSSLPQGMYIIRMNTMTGLQTTRSFIKE